MHLLEDKSDDLLAIPRIIVQVKSTFLGPVLFLAADEFKEPEVFRTDHW
jgi:hypothetical protein